MRRSAAGFTLVEVMVSLAILAVAIITLVLIRNQSVVQSQEARELAIGARLAQQKMGELEVLPVEDRADSGTFEDYPEYRWSKEIELEVLETSQAGSTEKPLEIWKVTLTVSWTGRDLDQPESIIVLSYRLKTEDETPKEAQSGKSGGQQGASAQQGGSAQKGGGS